MQLGWEEGTERWMKGGRDVGKEEREGIREEDRGRDG